MLPKLHLTLPILLHLLIETPASLSFLLTPSAQLPSASPEAKLILRNLGGLLLATNLVCLTLLFSADQQEHLTAQLCLCLGTYHVWPVHRAYTRIKTGRGTRVLGGPAVHLGVHLVCFVALVGGGIVGLRD